jgi:hypothetical protein
VGGAVTTFDGCAVFGPLMAVVGFWVDDVPVCAAGFCCPAGGCTVALGPVVLGPVVAAGGGATVLCCGPTVETGPCCVEVVVSGPSLTVFCGTTNGTLEGAFGTTGAFGCAETGTSVDVFGTPAGEFGAEELGKGP